METVQPHNANMVMEFVTSPLRTTPSPTPAEAPTNLWLMANLRPERTGLPFTVWVSTKDAGGNQAPHSARVKVGPGLRWVESEATSVSILPQPEHKAGPALRAADFARLARWIAINRDLLLALWESEIDHGDFIERQKPID